VERSGGRANEMQNAKCKMQPEFVTLVFDVPFALCIRSLRSGQAFHFDFCSFLELSGVCILAVAVNNFEMS
jgi:hypothetical protein